MYKQLTEKDDDDPPLSTDDLQLRDVSIIPLSLSITIPPSSSFHITSSKILFSNIKNIFIHQQLRNTLSYYHESLYYNYKNIIYKSNVNVNVNININKKEKDDDDDDVIIYDSKIYDKGYDVNKFLIMDNYRLYGLKKCKKMILENKYKKRKFIEVYKGYELNSVVLSNDEVYIYGVGQSCYFFVYKIYNIDEIKIWYIWNLKSYGNDVQISKDNRYICCVTDKNGYYIFEKPNGNDSKGKLFFKKNIVTDDNCDFCNFNCKSNKLIVCNYELLRIFSLESMKEEMVVDIGYKFSIAKFSPNNPEMFVLCTCERSESKLILGEIKDENVFKSYEIDSFKNKDTLGLCFNSSGTKIFLSIKDNNLDKFGVIKEYTINYNNSKE